MSTTKRVLFIGGPDNGKWHRIEAPLPLIMVMPVSVPGVGFLSSIKGYFTGTKIINHEYWLTTLHIGADGSEVAFYRHNSLSLKVALEKLLAHYEA